MLQLIKSYPAQILEAIAIGEKANLRAASGNITNVVICGLGGSGIGGNLVSELLRDELKVPVTVNKGYAIPAFASASTLLILGSYSGNTEETLSCAIEALKKGLKPVCITSGGQLLDIATKNNLNVITIPGGLPPRAALGYSLTQLFFILKHYGLISDNFREALTRSANFIQAEQPNLMKAGEALASKLNRKNIILYSEDKYESISLRIKQQINENSKMLCWYNTIPELNHNELVGWREGQPHLGVIFLRSSEENNRNTARIQFTKNVIEKNSANNVYEVEAKGKDTFEKHFYLIHFGDWLSYYLAIQQNYDPIEIDVLIALKDHMTTIK